MHLQTKFEFDKLKNDIWSQNLILKISFFLLNRIFQINDVLNVKYSPNFKIKFLTNYP